MTMDGTKEGKDKTSAEPGDTSGQTKGTSKDKGKVYTDDDIAKIKSDAAAEAGRLRAKAERERDALKGELEATNTRLEALERAQNESRLAEARDNPAALTALQRDQETAKRARALEDQERDLRRREEQYKADREAVDRDMAKVSIATIAANHGLETETLESLGISDHDTLEKVAAQLASVGKPKGTAGDEGGEGGEGSESFEPDGGETSGGESGPLSTEKVEEMSLSSVEKALEKASEK